jgi:EmrB/QacA subfamily drug resistance transporter
LHSPLSTIQWVSTGYLLSLAMVIPLAGWLSERFGSKRVWMISVAVFALGSALCGTASSAGSLIFFRVLQGFGGGLIMPVGMSVLAQTAGPRHMGRVMSVIGMPMLLGPVLGPVLGGLIVTNAAWQWIFYVNVPIAALSLILAARLSNSTEGRADAGRLDWPGVVLLCPGLAGIVFGLAETETSSGLSSPSAWGPIAAGAVLIALFVRHALRARRPLIDLHLFRSVGFSAAAATTFLLGGALFGSMLLLPLYYQVDRGASALSAGLLMAPQGIGAALVMPISGRLTDRIGGGRVAVSGIAVMTLATIPLVTVGATSSYAWLAVVLALRGVGLGGSMMPTMASAYAVLRSDQVPGATSILTRFNASEDRSERRCWPSCSRIRHAEHSGRLPAAAGCSSPCRRRSRPGRRPAGHRLRSYVLVGTRRDAGGPDSGKRAARHPAASSPSDAGHPASSPDQRLLSRRAVRRSASKTRTGSGRALMQCAGMGNRCMEMGAVPRRTRDLHLAAERFDPIAQPAYPAAGAAGAVGAADAVVADVDQQVTVAAPHVELGVGGLGVLDDVGERLGDEEVACDFDVRRVALVADGHLNGQRAPRGEGGCCCAESAVRENAWMYSVGELTELRERFACLGESRLEELPGAVHVSVERLVGQLQVDDGGDQSLLSAVVEIAREALAGGVGGGDDSRPRGDHL